jgi:hypothetical protein
MISVGIGVIVPAVILGLVGLGALSLLLWLFRKILRDRGVMLHGEERLYYRQMHELLGELASLESMLPGTWEGIPEDIREKILRTRQRVAEVEMATGRNAR